MIGKTNAVCGTPDGGNSDRRTYFGTGADGDLHITAAQTYTVDVVEDSESAILNLKSLVIDEGGVLTTSGRCQGLFVKVDGDCTINGTINMDKKAPREAVNDAELAQNPCIVLCGSPVGGNGGSGGTNTQSQSSYTRYHGGSGGAGYVFGGGSGGGGASNGENGSDGTRAPVGVTWPYTKQPPLYGCGGGGTGIAGGAAPGGGGYNNVSGKDGDAYGGGAIYLFVYGALTIGSTGKLTANGGNGAAGQYYHHSSSGYSNSTYSGSGGGGGGGVICIVYNATIVHGGQLSVAGGTSTSYTSNNICTGTSGSVGTTMTAKFETLQK